MKQVLLSLFKNSDVLDLQSKLTRHACVSIILKGSSIQNLEIAFIQRALNPDDRWSGHLAFPGGTREISDSTDLDAALRETQEEVGISLNPDELLGRLDDVHAKSAGNLLDFYIRPFVFYIQRDFEVTVSTSEVAEFFWIPLNEIKNPARQTHYEFKHTSGITKLPAIDLNRDLPLWGLTHKMVLNLIERFSLVSSLN